ncbi:cyclin-D5-3-like [Nicotiana tabacum]|uniref:cyclin-D5-3-like n=1 Tax=Nicotiana tabacum TaxID=4097 RepID=UPI003F4EF307
MENTFSYSSLLREEEHTLIISEENGDEYIQMLIDREIASFGLLGQNSSHVTNFDWIQQARLAAVQYILKTGESFGFRFQTVYIAVTYCDGFLSRRFLDGEKQWAVKLLAVACLSLAAKMEECKVPTLTEYPSEEYIFESRVTQRMELLVLNTLEWRMGCITPFYFINYFVSRFCKNDSRKCVISSTVEIIFGALRDIKLMSVRPSVLAAAATLLVLNKSLTMEALEVEINVLHLNGILQIDDVFSCYNQMLYLNKEICKSHKCLVSPQLSPNQLLRNW